MKTYLDNIARGLANFPLATFETIVAKLYTAIGEDRQIFVFGNGGSAATASHFVCDLTKCLFLESGTRVRAFSLPDNVPLISAWGNDTAYHNIFTGQLESLAREGDVFFGISGSGNSPNVLSAMKLGRKLGVLSIGLTGFEGGELSNLTDLCLITPGKDMQQIEDFHLITTHMIYRSLKEIFTNSQSD